MYSRIPDWFCSWIDAVFKSYWHIPTTSNYLLSIDVQQLFHTFQEFFSKDHEYWMALFCKEFVQVTVSFFFAYKEYHHCLQKSIKWILRINKKQKWLILTGTWPWNRVLNTLTTIQFHNKYCIFFCSPMSELPPNAVTFDWNCLTGVIICGAHVAPFVKRGVSKRKGPKYNRIVFTVGVGG